MAEFIVSGPLNLPIKLLATGAIILNEQDIKNLVKKLSGHDTRGCYVLTVRGPNQGHTPIYVGKTGKRLLIDECLTSRNIKFLNEALNKKLKRRPSLFFIYQSKSKGRWNESQIGQVEEYLIANAATKNEELFNRTLLPQQNWRIKGVANSKKGESTKASGALRKALNIT